VPACGQGIEPESLPFVFDRFRQADPSWTRRAGGLGLGLAIVRSLVELHGGTVVARSAGKGQGAEFQVRLPTAPVRADRADKQLLAAAEDDPCVTFDCPEELRGLSVLVVDDEPDTRELIRYLLEQCEARVSMAASADEALAQLTEASFHVLVRTLPPERNGRIPAIAPRRCAQASPCTWPSRSSRASCSR
jgi:hypothetical protein